MACGTRIRAPDDRFRPVVGVKEVYKSFGAEYNLLFTLPIVPFQKVFGQSRTATPPQINVLASMILFGSIIVLAVGTLFSQRRAARHHRRDAAIKQNQQRPRAVRQYE